MITANDTITPQTADPHSTAAGMLGTAGDIYKTMGAEGSLTNINSYLNPYYDQVINAALGRLGTQEQMALNQIGDSAIAAGAFGGSRHGIVEGVTRGEFGKAAGELAGNLGMQSFESAADRAFRDQVTSAQGLTGLGGQYYNIGNDIIDRQMNQGTLQQQLMQAILGSADNTFQGLLQNPYQMIDLFNAVLASDPRRANVQGTTQSRPGLLDIASAGLQAWAGAG